MSALVPSITTCTRYCLAKSAETFLFKSSKALTDEHSDEKRHTERVKGMGVTYVQMVVELKSGVGMAFGELERTLGAQR